MAQWASEIGRSSAELAERYRAGALHALRVRIRRSRSILKWTTGQRARRFRQSWGGFASTTGDARDWDVFDQTARDLLKEGEYTALRHLTGDAIECSHESVLEMVRSAPWRRHLREWRQFVSATSALRPGQVQCAQWLESARATARQRLESALACDDDRSWHRLRIATKNLRYLAEACGGQLADENGGQRTVNECKPIQALLGEWHDAVVQLQLLEDLPDAAVCQRLRSAIAERQQRLRAQCREQLSGQPFCGRGP